MANLNIYDRLPTLPIMGVNIVLALQDEAIRFLDYLFQAEVQTAIAFANTNLLNIARKDTDFGKTLASFVVFNDGLGLDIASRVIHGRTFPDNLNGTDFIPAYLEKSAHSLRVFIFGGRLGIAEKCLLNLALRYPRHQFVGSHTGYFRADETAGIVQKIRDAKADVLFVGLGNPVQEKWLSCYLKSCGCRIGIGVGAFIDFSSGTIVRAPTTIRQLRVEWLFRLVLEPKRLFRRYLVEGVFFMIAAVREKYTRKTVNTLQPSP